MKLTTLLSIPAMILPCSAEVTTVRTDFPWTQNLPQDIRDQYLTPTQVIDEIPCDARAQLQQLFLPHIKNCKTAKDVALTVAPLMNKVTGVYYTIERRKACMNASECLAEKKASCSGLSIILVSTMRALGVPARIVGVSTWNHVRGNHNWTEVWVDGEWRMLEFGQSDFDTEWVLEAAGMLDSSEFHQRVLAVNGKPATGDDDYFILAWDQDNKTLGADDVSARYHELADAWYQATAKPEHANTQLLMVDLQPRHENPSSIALVEKSTNKILGEGHLPKPSDDVREMVRFRLPKNSEQNYELLLESGKRLPVSATSDRVQVIRLSPEQL